jgi:hypothetical protein
MEEQTEGMSPGQVVRELREQLAQRPIRPPAPGPLERIHAIAVRALNRGQDGGALGFMASDVAALCEIVGICEGQPLDMGAEAPYIRVGDRVLVAVPLAQELAAWPPEQTPVPIVVGEIRRRPEGLELILSRLPDPDGALRWPGQPAPESEARA